MFLENQAENRIKVVEIATVTASDVSLLPAYQQLLIDISSTAFTSQTLYRPTNNYSTKPSRTAKPKFISNCLQSAILWMTSEDVLILQ